MIYGYGRRVGRLRDVNKLPLGLGLCCPVTANPFVSVCERLVGAAEEKEEKTSPRKKRRRRKKSIVSGNIFPNKRKN